MVTFPIPALVMLLLLPQLASSNTRTTLEKMSRKVRFIGPPVTKKCLRESRRTKSGCNKATTSLTSTDVKGLSRFMSFGHGRKDHRYRVALVPRYMAAAEEPKKWKDLRV